MADATKTQRRKSSNKKGTRGTGRREKENDYEKENDRLLDHVGDEGALVEELFVRRGDL